MTPLEQAALVVTTALVVGFGAFAVVWPFGAGIRRAVERASRMFSMEGKR